MDKQFIIRVENKKDGKVIEFESNCGAVISADANGENDFTTHSTQFGHCSLSELKKLSEVIDSLKVDTEWRLLQEVAKRMDNVFARKEAEPDKKEDE